VKGDFSPPALLFATGLIRSLLRGTSGFGVIGILGFSSGIDGYFFQCISTFGFGVSTASSLMICIGAVFLFFTGWLTT
jgi:hypothetical protein